MGKRKLHEQTYFQCDWTGLPMRASNCYLPHWKDGKLFKMGSFCNWESVVAFVYDNKETTEEDRRQVVDYITNLVGKNVVPAPHWSKLKWFTRDEAGGITEGNFFELCTAEDSHAECVRILPSGDVLDLQLVHTNESEQWHKFTSQRSSRKQPKDREIEVFYQPKGKILNTTASTIFKMQIHGDCIVACKTKENSLLPRVRYTPFSKLDFNEQFTSKRKREQDGLTGQQYSELHSEMQESLCAVEARASASSDLPQALAHAAVMPPASGQELAALAADLHPELVKRLHEGQAGKIALLEERLSRPIAAH